MTDCNLRKDVCRECPFRRKSAPGYLGEASYDPHGFVGPHYHGDVRLPCHMQVDWEDKTGKKSKTLKDAPLCRGFVIFIKNNVKWPENGEVRIAVDKVEVDRENIFGWMHEFVAHHSSKRG